MDKAQKNLKKKKEEKKLKKKIHILKKPTKIYVDKKSGHKYKMTKMSVILRKQKPFKKNMKINKILNKILEQKYIEITTNGMNKEQAEKYRQQIKSINIIKKSIKRGLKRHLETDGQQINRLNDSNDMKINTKYETTN